MGPLLRLVAESGAFIAFAITPDGIIQDSVGPARDAIVEERGETIDRSVFEAYADLPTVTGAVALALRGVPVHQRLRVEAMVLDCHFVPVHAADGAFLGVRGIAIVVESDEAAPGDLFLPGRSEDVLSKREAEVVRRLARGLPHVDIGDALHIEPTTVRSHLRSARRKLGLGSTGELHTYAVERGWHREDPADD